MSQQPAGPPPPYPGDGAYAPPNPGYPAPYDPVKGPPQAPPPPPNFSPWSSGYGNPNQPPMGYGMPQPYAQGMTGQTHATTVVVAQPAVTVVQSFRESPVHTNCPHCRAEVITGIYYETGTFTWLICCVLFLVGCTLGCCFIPFCVDGCKDVVHTCPNCNQQIARFSRM